jgi:D-sedoheptulose 7-phosphate isomerase
MLKLLDYPDFISDKLNESICVKQKITGDKGLLKKIEKVCSLSIKSLQNNKKIIFIGNGGSAADSQHLAAELVGKFNIDREPLPAISLNTNVSIISAIGNDYNFDYIFARQLRAIGVTGDILFCLSTSGNSSNIVNAILEAKKKAIKTVGLTGESGGEMRNIVDILINIPSNNTPRIQESHISVGHIICEIIENYFFSQERKNSISM